MELQERFSILQQAIDIAQKGGAFTLDEAVTAKQSIVAIQNGQYIKEGLLNLKKLAEKGQKAGVYTLRDAYTIYLASEGIENLVFNVPQPQPRTVPQNVENTQAEVAPESQPKKTIGGKKK